MVPDEDGTVDLDKFFEDNPEVPRPDTLGDIIDVTLTFVPLDPTEPITVENTTVEFCVHPEVGTTPAGISTSPTPSVTTTGPEEKGDEQSCL